MLKGPAVEVDREKLGFGVTVFLGVKLATKGRVSLEDFERAVTAIPEVQVVQHVLGLFDYRLRREAGSLSAVLGGLDVLAFTGGIGEHDPATRAELVHGLAYLGVRLDPAANRAAGGETATPIHAADSSAEVWVVPTDEGRIAADAAWQLLDRLPVGRTALL